MTSVSVWLRKGNPSASSSRRRASWFSMTPLWTTATAGSPRPPTCGWAFRSLAGPWVAHRVWLIPHDPAAGSRSRASSRTRTLPARFRTTRRSPSRVATPALSYPRYSSRRRPATRIGLASCVPMYPTIPHIGTFLSRFRRGTPTRSRAAGAPDRVRVEAYPGLTGRISESGRLDGPAVGAAFVGLLQGPLRAPAGSARTGPRRAAPAPRRTPDPDAPSPPAPSRTAPPGRTSAPPGRSRPPRTTARASAAAAPPAARCTSRRSPSRCSAGCTCPSACGRR